MRPIPFQMLLAFAALQGSAALAEAPQLSLPIDCVVGQTCFVQYYVDRDASPGVRDFMCGRRSNDGHNGTDIRLLTLEAQRKGVPVLAAATGRVLRVRDGVADTSIRDTGREAVAGRECGNGIVIAHEGRWETQYCHLAKGSVRVRSGDAVSAGHPIGAVGLSGDTEFPHLHFTVRHDGKVTDPFAHGAAEGACGSGISLWVPSAQAALAYTAADVLNAGFASTAVTMADVEAGAAGHASLDPASSALVAFVRAIGLREGDVQRLAIRDPEGRVVVDHSDKPLDRDKAQYLIFAGKRKPAAGWTRGSYRAVYTVTRAGNVVLERTFETLL